MRKVACLGLLGAVVLVGCGGGSSSGSDVPTDSVAVVDGQDITVADLVTTLNIAKIALKTSYPEPGTDQWISLRTRALEELAHSAQLRAWAKGLGVSVKPSAVDTAVKQALIGTFPGATAGTIDETKLAAEFKSTGMTKALFRERIETKLLAQAAANKIAGSPKVTDAQIKAQYDKDKSTLYVLPERRKVRHILVKTQAQAQQIYAQLTTSDADFASLAKQFSTDSTKTSGGDLGVINRNAVVKPFGDVAFTTKEGVVAPPVQTQFGWHVIEPTGPVLPKGTRPLDAALKAQIRSSLVEKARQKTIADRFQAAQLALSEDIQFAPGYAPAVQTSQ